MANDFETSDQQRIRELNAEIVRLRGRLMTRRKVFDAVWVAFVVLGCSFAIILGMHWLIYGPHHCD